MAFKGMAGIALGVVLLVQTAGCSGSEAESASAPSGGQQPAAPSVPTSAPTNTAAPAAAGTVTSPPATSDMETAKAVVVTFELDYGVSAPSIPEAARQLIRRQKAADGKGRVFAILDIFGERIDAGKLRISMHVSSEKPGSGWIMWAPTGQTIWEGRVIQGGTASPYSGGNLAIFINDGKGNERMIDGSGNPKSILDARVRDLNIPVRDFWPVGETREVTFVYSACGCPVRVTVQRTPEGTVRTDELPVIFPDDPPAVMAINGLFKW